MSSGRILSFSVMGRITRQGTPAAITPAGISWVTTLPAPITDPVRFPAASAVPSELSGYIPSKAVLPGSVPLPGYFHSHWHRPQALHNVYNVHVLRFLAFSFPENLTIYSNVTILLNGNILPMKCIFISFHKSPFSIGIFQNSSRQYSIFHGKTQICKFTLACIYHIITMGL